MSQRETVRSGVITEMVPSKVLEYVNALCAFAANSPEVQASPVLSQALLDLTGAAAQMGEQLSNKTNLIAALRAAIKALDGGESAVRKKLKVFEAGVDAVADGDGAVIARAGLPTRPVKPGAKALEPVKEVSARKGTQQGLALLSWPGAPGAGSYEVEVNFTSTDPAGPYTTLTAAANQSRAVTAPTPGLMFVARVTAVGHDGTKAAPSPAVIVTAA